MIGLAAVVADAAIIDSVIGLDVRRDDERAVPGARMGGGGGRVCVWGGEPAPGQREVPRVAVAPSGMRGAGAALASYSLAVRVASRPFLLDLQCVCLLTYLN